MEPTSWQVVLGSVFVLAYIFLIIQRDLVIRRVQYTVPRVPYERCDGSKTVEFFKFSKDIAENLPAEFISKVKERFAARLALLKKECFHKKQEPIFPTFAEFNRKFPKWYEFRGARFTDAISRDPAVFGCAALKSASGVLRTVVMNWAGEEFHSQTYLDHLRTFTNEDLSSILSSENALRILFVRNPMSRFCTAWGQKFKVGGEYQLHREEWLKNWPYLERYEKENTANVIGFDDFVDFFKTRLLALSTLIGIPSKTRATFADSRTSISSKKKLSTLIF
ncbi:Oidioi.mRNA.OKI2018_I69.XSR.g13765.t1.cds [Oikopleura dioica]|uniref:Oidioi.mRNA.OKI2018_I69.XSR.g13765.t1.cds n=1 Tax=Oikopleura dioica TaxID=34765 RepID=A0ABN7SEW0_OIKDI|nr:Oidioi.mRNA.OKI2018_I69.XSR.g13765.t1.cds [Oikopleura dioica]